MPGGAANCRRNTKKALRVGLFSPGERPHSTKLKVIGRCAGKCAGNNGFSKPGILPDFKVESPVSVGAVDFAAESAVG
ncbi:hypothetical protein [Massilia sp. Leaf139]|uniref:hypothetical protein n=1 Tax=Massilia sp. Leaf139 TaxID=1736272 RepID=UPI0012E97312|nr:hypothetical protein [Massilia sp. Leaf139]